MKCPCGCEKDVPNLRYFATRNCGRRANKRGIFMPANGEWRKDTRMSRKMKSLEKGKK